MIEKATFKGQDFILLEDMNYDYKNPIHYIESLYEMTQHITARTIVTECSETLLDVIVTTNSELHRVKEDIKRSLYDLYRIDVF